MREEGFKKSLEYRELGTKEGMEESMEEKVVKKLEGEKGWMEVVENEDEKEWVDVGVEEKENEEGIDGGKKLEETKVDK